MRLTAFELMLEEVDVQIDQLGHEGSQAFGRLDMERVNAVAGQVAWLQAFRDKVAALREEWVQHDLASSPPPDPPAEDDAAVAHRRSLGQLPRGARTPEPDYFPYILQVLVDLGGSAPTRDVIDRVGQRMVRVLRDVDRQTLASDPDTPRWRNTTHWARYNLAKQGLLRDDSPEGTWAISEAGRAWLATHGAPE